jgi:starvation-inducible DNA-binding protein
MKTQGYHWNVIGSDFPQLHDFFGDIYGELQGAIDEIAEQIRSINAFPQGTLARMIQLADIKEDEKIPPAAKMVTNLIDANQQVMDCVTEAYTMAENENEFALSNFLQDRLTAHAKHGWMLKATAGKTK